MRTRPETIITPGVPPTGSPARPRESKVRDDLLQSNALTPAPEGGEPDPRFWSAPPIWSGRSVFVVGGGVSVEGVDVTQLRRLPVITVNNSFEAVPFAPWHYFHDGRWFDWNEVKYRTYEGSMVTCSVPRSWLVGRAKVMERVRRRGKVEHPVYVARARWQLAGLDSGAQAINLAFHFGAARIVLLGFDMRAGEDGRLHHHEEHKQPSRENNYERRFLPEYAPRVEELRDLGVEVVSATPTAISCVEVVDYSGEIERCRRPPT